MWRVSQIAPRVGRIAYRAIARANIYNNNWGLIYDINIIILIYISHILIKNEISLITLFFIKTLI